MRVFCLTQRPSTRNNNERQRIKPHRAISTRRHRWVNEAIGHVSALVFLAPFEGFRHIHLQHHKHTNVEGKDP